MSGPEPDPFAGVDAVVGEGAGGAFPGGVVAVGLGGRLAHLRAGLAGEDGAEVGGVLHRIAHRRHQGFSARGLGATALAVCAFQPSLNTRVTSLPRRSTKPGAVRSTTT